MDMSENVKKVANVSLKSQALLNDIQASPVPILHIVPTNYSSVQNSTVLNFIVHCNIVQYSAWRYIRSTSDHCNL